MREIRVTLFGVGRVNRDVTRLLVRRPGFRIVAAYSRNPALAGSDLGELAGQAPLGVLVMADRAAALRERADIVVIATTSFLRELSDDIRAAAESGHNVICTGEEMAFPWSVDPNTAEELDRLARERNVTVLGAGLNPGLIFDALVVTASGLAWNVRQIRVRRVVNCSRFSTTILRRLGFGFSEDEFTAGVRQGRIYGHIGFPQSIRAVARRLEMPIDDVEKSVEAIIADRVYEMANMTIQAGQSAGFRQRVLGVARGRPWFIAELIGHAQPEAAGFEREDTIDIDGDSPVHLSIRPGCDAQMGSAAMMANSLRRVVEGPAGLLTVADLPPAAAPLTLGQAS